MNDSEILLLAEQFVEPVKSDLLFPGKITLRDSDYVEVIFHRAETLDPNAVVEPPFIRIWVNVNTKKVMLMLEVEDTAID